MYDQCGDETVAIHFPAGAGDLELVSRIRCLEETHEDTNFFEMRDASS